MRKILILILAGVFFAIVGCQREQALSEEDAARSARLLKDEILSVTNGPATLTNQSPLQTIEPIAVATNEPPTNVVPEIVPIEDKPIEKPRETPPPPPRATPAPAPARPATVPKVGSYMRIGSDRSGQRVSPRRHIKISSWVFTQEGRTVDFFLYAVPYKSGNIQSSHLIGRVRGIEVINNQAQFTRYWNGITIHRNFLPKGNYNIYLTYVIKDANGRVIKTESRYWGRSTDFFLRLQ